MTKEEGREGRVGPATKEQRGEGRRKADKPGGRGSETKDEGDGRTSRRKEGKEEEDERKGGRRVGGWGKRRGGSEFDQGPRLFSSLFHTVVS